MGKLDDLLNIKACEQQVSNNTWLVQSTKSTLKSAIPAL